MVFFIMTKLRFQITSNMLVVKVGVIHGMRWFEPPLK